MFTEAKPDKQRTDRPAAVGAELADRRQIIVLLGVVVYVLGFYLLEHLLKSVPIKSRALTWLLLPDDLAAQWVGGHVARFGLLDRLPVVLGTAAILGGGFLLGRLVLDWLRADRYLTRLEVALTSLGVGLNLLSLGTLSAGLAGLLQQQFVFLTAGLLIGVLGLFRWQHWRHNRATVACPSATPLAGDRLAPIALALSVPFVILILLGGMLPPWQFDVREYHLQVPKEWYQTGRIHFLPHNVYGNMPLGAEMHAVLGMALLQGWRDWWWGALVGKTVIACFAPLAALAVYALGSRFVSKTAGGVGAFVFISTPWIAHVSMAGLIEGSYAFYLVMAVHLTLMATRPRDADSGVNESNSTESSSARSRVLVLLAGFLAGSSVACKYPALLFVVAPLSIWIGLVPLGTMHGRRLTMFGLGVVCACGLWFGKNWVQTENPTYPLLYEWFDGRTRTPEKHEQWSQAHRTPANGWGIKRLADSLTTVTVTSDYLSPLLIPLGLIGLFSRRQRGLVLPLAAILIFVFTAWWLLTHRIDRFLVPLLPLAAVLAAVGATWSSGIVWRRCLIGLLVWGCVANCLLIASRDVSDNRFFVKLAELRADRENPYDEGYFHLHRTHDVLNQEVQPGFTALLVGEAQVFNLEVPVRYNTCFDDCVFERLMKGRTRPARLDALRQHRISHVFIFWRELDRYRSPGNYGYSDYVTRERIYREFVDEQQLLKPVPLDSDPENNEVFEVVGWQDWNDQDRGGSEVP